jgi:hypothetical protein
MTAKTVFTVFMVGIISLSVLSILGLIYITKMSFSPNTDECGKVNKTGKGIARLTTVLLWIQIVWIVLGTIIQTLMSYGTYNV